MALSARIRTRDGWAVPHAVVTVTDMTGTQLLRVAADSEGNIVDDTHLAPGHCTAIITAVGYAPLARTAIVTATGRADLGNLVLARQGGVELPPPGPWTVDSVNSSVAAAAQHLGLSSVRGRFLDFDVRIEIAEDAVKSRVEAVIRAASIDTGNRMRDDHLRSTDFLDVDRFPEITYVSTGLTPTAPDRWTVHGELSLHGVVRPVDLDLAYLGTGPDPWGGFRAAFRATAELHRDDFAISYNEVVRVGIAAVGAKLKVELDIQAVQGDGLTMG
ncbi:YceI family protein [Actinobacteria bacterium OK074]|nr:YceI family protein [Actinobacteria bacterium OK074]